MDDALLVCVLHRLADLDEQREAIAGRKLLLVAVVSDLDAPNQFHDEEWPPSIGRPRIEDPGDIRMVHQSQRLAFRLESGDHAFGVHAQLNNLKGNLAAYGFLLLG